MWGFSVEAELIENAERQDELCCYVSRVEDKGIAIQNGNQLFQNIKVQFQLVKILKINILHCKT